MQRDGMKVIWFSIFNGGGVSMEILFVSKLIPKSCCCINRYHAYKRRQQTQPFWQKMCFTDVL